VSAVSKIIKLTQGKETIVDDDVYEWAKEFKWYAANWKTGFYAGRGGKQINKKREPNIALHREIMNPPKGFMVDHINGNTLDNRRENLRICTNTQNQKNSKLSKTNTSGYKGVSWHIVENKWIARIRVNGKLIHLGYFDDILLAAKAYDEAAIKYNGEFAKGNDALPC
jgi:hypothetical protein